MQLPGCASARQYETSGRFAHAGKCERADDGAVGAAATACGLNSESAPIVDLACGAYIAAYSMAVARKQKPDLQRKVHEVPHKPGVYLMRDRFNRVIYVGKARDLRKRVSSYFLPSKLAQADLKTRAMLEATWDFETHTVRSDAESVLLEGK